MLILTRKVDQAIIIQGNILVTVLRVERDRVKLGISAPEEITVLREELLERNGGANKTESEANREEKGLPPFPRSHFSKKLNRAPEGSSSDASNRNQR
jgi:carbon storage regulator